MCFKYIYIFMSDLETKTLYYIDPSFKYKSLFVYIIILIPIAINVVYIVLDLFEKDEGFQDNSLEQEIIEKNNDKDSDEDDWDVIEYIGDKINAFKKYMTRMRVIDNENGRKVISIRYNIE